jgi:hypothetical protein
MRIVRAPASRSWRAKPISAASMTCPSYAVVTPIAAYACCARAMPSTAVSIDSIGIWESSEFMKRSPV